MRKNLLLPLFAAIVAGGGALASNAAGTQVSAYGKNALGQCVSAPLFGPENCSTLEEAIRCEVTIDGNEVPAWLNPDCTGELFRPIPD